MWKKYLIIILVIFLSGCTAEYNLKISDNKIEEEFISTIYKDEIPTQTVEGIEIDDQLTPFIEQEQYPFFDNYDTIYDKEVIEEDDYRLVKLKYTYNKEDFSNSNALKKCFESVEYSYDDNYIFNLSGNFYCLYNDKLDINVITKNKVLSNNAVHVKGNTYTWHINQDNVNDVNIKMEIERNTLSKKISNYSLLIIVFSIVIFATVVALIVIKKRKNHNKI